MIRRLARCIREYKWAALLSPLCMVGEVTMEVIIPLVMKDLYDYGVKYLDMQVIATKSLLLVLCALASLCFGVASAIFASRAGTGLLGCQPGQDDLHKDGAVSAQTEAQDTQGSH